MLELTQIPVSNANLKEENSHEKKLPFPESLNNESVFKGQNVNKAERNPTEQMAPKYDPHFLAIKPHLNHGTIQMAPNMSADLVQENEKNDESDDSELQLPESPSNITTMSGTDDDGPDDNKSSGIQPKLKIGNPGDKYEKEADAVADQVMRMPDNKTLKIKPDFNTAQINMKCTECQEEEEIQMQPIENMAVEPLSQTIEEEDQIQLKTAVTAKKTSVIDLNQNLNNTKGRGKALSAEISEMYGNSIGADFTNVNIHTDSNAVQMNKQLGARAFTHGKDIYFNQNQFNPQSQQGAHLLAHELTHTVQQSRGSEMIQRNPGDGNDETTSDETTELIPLLPSGLLDVDRGSATSIDTNATLIIIVYGNDMKLYDLENNLLAEFNLSISTEIDITGIYSNIGMQWGIWISTDLGNQELFGFIDAATDEQREQLERIDSALTVPDWFTSQEDLDTYNSIQSTHRHVIMLVDLRGGGSGRRTPAPSWARVQFANLQEAIANRRSQLSEDDEAGRAAIPDNIQLWLQQRSNHPYLNVHKGNGHLPLRMRQEEVLVDLLSRVLLLVSQIPNQQQSVGATQAPPVPDTNTSDEPEIQDIWDQIAVQIYRAVHGNMANDQDQVVSLLTNRSFGDYNLIKGRFQQRYNLSLHGFLRWEMTSILGAPTDQLIKSFALMDKGHWNHYLYDKHVQLGLAILPASTRDDEFIHVFELSQFNENRRPAIRHEMIANYNSVFRMLGHGTLNDDIEAKLWSDKKDKALILHERNLTPADQLYLETQAIMGTNTSKALTIIQQEWDADKVRFTKFQQLIRDWNVLRNGTPHLTNDSLYSAMQSELYAEEPTAWALFLAIWNGYLSYQQLAANREEGQDLTAATEQLRLDVAYETLRAATFMPGTNEEQVFRSIQQLREVYMERIEQAPENEKENLRQEWRNYAERLRAWIPNEMDEGTEDNRRARLLLARASLSYADRIYVAGSDGEQVVHLLTEAWQKGLLELTITEFLGGITINENGQEVTVEHPAENPTQILFRHGVNVTNSENWERAYSLVRSDGGSQANRGSLRLYYEIGKNGWGYDDSDLRDAYNLLNGIDSSQTTLRTETISEFLRFRGVRSTLGEMADNNNVSNTYKFLNYLLRKGLEVTNTYYEMLNLLDPPEDERERFQRALGMERAEHSGVGDTFLMGFVSLYDAISGEDTQQLTDENIDRLRQVAQDAQRANASPLETQAVFQMLGVSNLDEISVLEFMDFERHLNDLRSIKHTIAEGIATAVEIAVEVGLTILTGGGAAPALLASLAAAATAMLVREALLGNQYQLVSRENLQQLAITAVSHGMQAGTRNLFPLSEDQFRQLSRMQAFRREALLEGYNQTIVQTLTVGLEGRMPNTHDVISVISGALGAGVQSDVARSLNNSETQLNGFLTEVAQQVSNGLVTDISQEVGAIAEGEDTNFGDILTRLGRTTASSVMRSTATAGGNYLGEQRSSRRAEGDTDTDQPDQTPTEQIDEDVSTTVPGADQPNVRAEPEVDTIDEPANAGEPSATPDPLLAAANSRIRAREIIEQGQHSGESTTPHADLQEIIPESGAEQTPDRIPETELLSDAERVPDSTTGVPNQVSAGPTIAERQAQIDWLTSTIGEIPPGLQDLLMFDHNLLQRAQDDPSIITAVNKHAWNEIGMLGRMRSETYDVLLHNDGLRLALIDNPRAAEALRHCASPCFPPNASADDVLVLQQLLTERAITGLKTNMNALNEFLYGHRSASDLGDVIRMLHSDFEGTLQRTGAASQLAIPESWAEGSDSRPGRLTTVISYFQTMEIPLGLANSILENIHRLPDAEQRTIINDELNFLLSRRAVGEFSLTTDRLLYGLSDPATFAMTRFMLERFRNQASLVDSILVRTSMETFQRLRDGSSAMEPRELIQKMASLLSRVQSDNPADILQLIERAGYPAPEEGASNPDIDRLIDLLNRNGSSRPLSPAEAWAVVEHANAAREAVAGGDLNLPFSADAVRGDTSRTSIGSKLRHHIDHIIMQSDALPQIFNQILGGETGTVVDSVRFGEVSEVIRAQIDRLIRIDLADQFEHPLTDRQVQAMVNSIWRPKRGVLFERVHDYALRRLHGEDNVWRQAGVSTQTGMGTATRSVPTVVDNIVLIRDGNVLRVLFFEYKAGGATEETGQSTLREHITGGGGIDGIAFDTPRSREILARIEAARQDGATIQLEHIPVNEER